MSASGKTGGVTIRYAIYEVTLAYAPGTMNQTMYK